MPAGRRTLRAPLRVTGNKRGSIPCETQFADADAGTSPTFDRNIAVRGAIGTDNAANDRRE
jgi:hypothetical protein